MEFGYIIDYVQSTLDDVGVHYTQSGVSAAINEANEIMGLTTLCHERTSTDWQIETALSATGDTFIALPPDCIVPIYVRDTVTRKRVLPAKASDFGLEAKKWWRETGTGFQYYSLWNPGRTWTYGSSQDTKFAMILYPKVASATLQLAMNYAAVPPTLQTTANNPNIPEGFDMALGDFAIFCGMMRRKVDVQTCVGFLQRFFEGIEKVNESMKSRYPNGRDFEPAPIETVLQRTRPVFSQGATSDRNRTSRRNR